MNVTFRMLTGRRTVGAFILAAVLILTRCAWKSFANDQNERDAMTMAMAPAMDKLSESELIRSDWHYVGPLGEFDIRFVSGGTLEMLNDPASNPGHWSIIPDPMLTISMPGMDSPHQAIFKDSQDLLIGPDPTGKSDSWSAYRIN